MRLNRLWIGEFKNLKNFEITFDPISPYTVLVGPNGSGKSNVFEALLQIFDALERRKPPAFAYQLEYSCRSQRISIDYNPVRPRYKMNVSMVNKEDLAVHRWIPTSQFFREAADPSTRLLPEFVFGYYSGLCSRFESPFRDYRRRYTQQLRQAEDGAPIPRRLLYGDLSFAELIIVALWAHLPGEGLPEGILKSLGVRSVTNVQMQLQPSSRFDPEADEPRSLGLRGPMRDFVSELDLLALEDQTRSSGEGKELRKEYVFSDEGLRKLAAFAERHRTNLFNLLLQLREEGALRSLSCALLLPNGDSVTSEALSEGEKQLLLVMGMLRFSENEEALFLLDEPDTHLNPVWSLQYLKLAEAEMGHKPTGHIIMATHDPLMFAGLTRSEVRVLKRNENDNSVEVDIPHRDPKGTGVPAILMSDIFGLRSVLDLETQGLLDEKRQLAVKDERTEEENRRLKELNQILRDVDVSQIVSDPLYRFFVELVVRHKDYDQLRRVFLDEEMRGLRDEITKRVADAMREALRDHEVH